MPVCPIYCWTYFLTDLQLEAKRHIYIFKILYLFSTNTFSVLNRSCNQSTPLGQANVSKKTFWKMEVAHYGPLNISQSIKRRNLRVTLENTSGSSKIKQEKKKPTSGNTFSFHHLLLIYGSWWAAWVKSLQKIDAACSAFTQSKQWSCRCFVTHLFIFPLDKSLMTFTAFQSNSSSINTCLKAVSLQHIHLGSWDLELKGEKRPEALLVSLAGATVF